MTVVRKPQDIYKIQGDIENGTFQGRWHFSFGDYYDPEFSQFGTLRVLNDDTLSPGAVWPLHSHKEIEVLTYCASGEFRHADEHGKGGVLKPGWVQHTTVGKGMWHSEINNRKDAPLRFIQMWFIPQEHRLDPHYEQRHFEKAERTNRLLEIASNKKDAQLLLHSDSRVFSSFLEAGKTVIKPIEDGRGIYLYVLEGGPLILKGGSLPALAAVEIQDEKLVTIKAQEDTEFLIVDTSLKLSGRIGG